MTGQTNEARGNTTKLVELAKQRSLQIKQLLIGALGFIFLGSLLFVQWMEVARKNEEAGLLAYEEINERLAKSKVKLIDVEFPPEEESILGRADKSLIDDTVNHWRRPD